MHYVIYFADKALYVGNDFSSRIQNRNNEEGVFVIEGLSNAHTKSVLAQIQDANTKAGFYIGNDPEKLLEALKAEMTVLQAGGGLVFTPQQEILLIFRRGKWDLPKGKLDEGETLESCALREVKEETGLATLEMDSPLLVTYHTYYQDGKLILKESHWYTMRSEKEQDLTPQLEEDIEQCIWVPLSETADYMQNTHPSIIDVIKAGMDNLKS